MCGARPASRIWGWAVFFAEIVPPERLVATERFDESWCPGDALDTTVFVEEGDIVKVANHGAL